MKDGLIQRISVHVLPFCAAWLLRIWFATCRITVHNVEYREMAEDQKKAVIATFWHYSLVYVLYHMRTESAVALVSASKDGEYIAKLAQNLDFETVRGSRNRKGLRALKELIICLNRGKHIAVVADGSQGPSLVVQPGSILMASRTGSPILPIGWSASSYYTFKSWDRTAIPRPFSRIAFFYGEPLLVPEKLDGEGIEQYRLILEERMIKLYHKAWFFYNRDRH